MTDRQKVVAELIWDTKRFNQQTDGAIRKASTLQTNMSKIGTGLKFAGGVAAFAGLTLGASALVGVLGEAAVAFREDEVSQRLLGQALKNNIPNWDGNTEAVEAYASAQAKLGFTDDEVRESLGQLVGLTHDLTEAQELNSLAQELARAKGIDLATASDVITRALQGNSRALKVYGIDIEGAADATEIMDRIWQNVKGSAEAYAQTSEGKVAISQVKVAEAMEKIGAAVDKLAQIALPALAGAFEWLIRGMERFITVAEGVITAISRAITKAREFTNLETGRGGGGSFGPAPKTGFRRIPSLFGIPLIPRVQGGFVDGGGGYLVGEQGPELFVPKEDGEIIPHQQKYTGSRTPNALFNRGGPIFKPGIKLDASQVIDLRDGVLPHKQKITGSRSIFHIYFNGPVYGDGPFLDELSNRIAQRLRYATGR